MAIERESTGIVIASRRHRDHGQAEVSPEKWAAFFAVVTIAYAVPGPDALVVLRYATLGRRNGWLAALGAQTGLAVHMLLAVAGLGILIAAHPGALAVIRVVGGAYLIWMGLSLLRSTAIRPKSDVDEQPGRGGHPFLRGLFTNLTNPKAILFFVAVLPQFIDTNSPAAPQVLLLGTIDVAVGFIPWALVIILGARLGERFTTARFARRRDTVAGGALCLIGLAMILTRVG